MAPAPARPELNDVPAGPERDRWVPLLVLADEPEPLRAYLNDGDLYGLVGEDGAPRAAILVIEDRPGVVELRAVAVDEAVQGQGIGFRLTHVERDFFSPENGYPSDLEEHGIRTLDMVWMDLDLAPFSLGG